MAVSGSGADRTRSWSRTDADWYTMVPIMGKNAKEKLWESQTEITLYLPLDSPFYFWSILKKIEIVWLFPISCHFDSRSQCVIGLQQRRFTLFSVDSYCEILYQKKPFYKNSVMHLAVTDIFVRWQYVPFYLALIYIENDLIIGEYISYRQNIKMEFLNRTALGRVLLFKTSEW